MSGEDQYQLSFLSEDQFPRIRRCFVEAFADYHIDMSYMTEESMHNRMIKNGVDFTSSVGVFEKEKMVGFTLVGIDKWKKELAAFDAGTGIIPGHRGQGLARKMFDFSIPKLKTKGVKTFVLEVLQVNKAAINAYQKSGFGISRELDCFKLQVKDFKPPGKNPDFITIQPVGKDILSLFINQLDWHPSWENSFSSIVRIPDELYLYGAFSGEKCIGVVGYYPGLKWLVTLVVHRAFRRRGVARQLLAYCIANLPGDTAAISLINVEHTDTGMIRLIEQSGFKLDASQFEMERDI